MQGKRRMLLLAANFLELATWSDDVGLVEARPGKAWRRRAPGEGPLGRGRLEKEEEVRKSSSDDLVPGLDAKTHFDRTPRGCRPTSVRRDTVQRTSSVVQRTIGSLRCSRRPVVEIRGSCS